MTFQKITFLLLIIMSSQSVLFELQELYAPWRHADYVQSLNVLLLKVVAQKTRFAKSRRAALSKSFLGRRKKHRAFLQGKILQTSIVDRYFEDGMLGGFFNIWENFVKLQNHYYCPVEKFIYDCEQSYPWFRRFCQEYRRDHLSGIEDACHLTYEDYQNILTGKFKQGKYRRSFVSHDIMSSQSAYGQLKGSVSKDRTNLKRRDSQNRGFNNELGQRSRSISLDVRENRSRIRNSKAQPKFDFIDQRDELNMSNSYDMAYEALQLSLRATPTFGNLDMQTKTISIDQVDSSGEKEHLGQTEGQKNNTNIQKAFLIEVLSQKITEGNMIRLNDLVKYKRTHIDDIKNGYLSTRPEESNGYKATSSKMLEFDKTKAELINQNIVFEEEMHKKQLAKYRLEVENLNKELDEVSELEQNDAPKNLASVNIVDQSDEDDDEDELTEIEVKQMIDESTHGIKDFFRSVAENYNAMSRNMKTKPDIKARLQSITKSVAAANPKSLTRNQNQSAVSYINKFQTENSRNHDFLSKHMIGVNDRITGIIEQEKGVQTENLQNFELEYSKNRHVVSNGFKNLSPKRQNSLTKRDTRLPPKYNNADAGYMSRNNGRDSDFRLRKPGIQSFKIDKDNFARNQIDVNQYTDLYAPSTNKGSYIQREIGTAGIFDLDTLHKELVESNDRAISKVNDKINHQTIELSNVQPRGRAGTLQNKNLVTPIKDQTIDNSSIKLDSEVEPVREVSMDLKSNPNPMNKDSNTQIVQKTSAINNDKLNESDNVQLNSAFLSKVEKQSDLNTQGLIVNQSYRPIHLTDRVHKFKNYPINSNFRLSKSIIQQDSDLREKNRQHVKKIYEKIAQIRQKKLGPGQVPLNQEMELTTIQGSGNGSVNSLQSLREKSSVSNKKGTEQENVRSVIYDTVIVDSPEIKDRSNDEELINTSNSATYRGKQTVQDYEPSKRSDIEPKLQNSPSKINLDSDDPTIRDGDVTNTELENVYTPSDNRVNEFNKQTGVRPKPEDLKKSNGLPDRNPSSTHIFSEYGRIENDGIQNISELDKPEESTPIKLTKSQTQNEPVMVSKLVPELKTSISRNQEKASYVPQRTFDNISHQGQESVYRGSRIPSEYNMKSYDLIASNLNDITEEASNETSMQRPNTQRFEEFSDSQPSPKFELELRNSQFSQNKKSDLKPFDTLQSEILNQSNASLESKRINTPISLRNVEEERLSSKFDSVVRSQQELSWNKDHSQPQFLWETQNNNLNAPKIDIGREVKEGDRSFINMMNPSEFAPSQFDHSVNQSPITRRSKFVDQNSMSSTQMMANMLDPVYIPNTDQDSLANQTMKSNISDLDQKNDNQNQQHIALGSRNQNLRQGFENPVQRPHKNISEIFKLNDSNLPFNKSRNQKEETILDYSSLDRDLDANDIVYQIPIRSPASSKQGHSHSGSFENESLLSQNQDESQDINFSELKSGFSNISPFYGDNESNFMTTRNHQNLFEEPLTSSRPSLIKDFGNLIGRGHVISSSGASFQSNKNRINEQTSYQMSGNYENNPFLNNQHHLIGKTDPNPHSVFDSSLNHTPSLQNSPTGFEPKIETENQLKSSLEVSKNIRNSSNMSLATNSLKKRVRILVLIETINCEACVNYYTNSSKAFEYLMSN